MEGRAASETGGPEQMQGGFLRLRFPADVQGHSGYVIRERALAIVGKGIGAEDKNLVLVDKVLMCLWQSAGGKSRWQRA